MEAVSQADGEEDVSQETQGGAAQTATLIPHSIQADVLMSMVPRRHVKHASVHLSQAC